MLSLDGEKHRRHRAAFVDPFRPRAVRDRFACSIRAEAERLIDSWAPARSAELRRSFAGPVSAAIVAQALGLHAAETPKVRAWYESIVSGVTAITAGEDVPSLAREAFSALSSRLGRAIDGGAEGSVLGAAANSGLDRAQVISNAAVLLFGGVETTEGMIANAALHLLERPAHLDAVRADERLLAVAIEESLRLEPPAAVVDRYTTEDIEVAGARIARGELVRLSISAANRDPGAFANPDELDLSGANGRRHLAFAHGPHVCLGIHLARLEARTALATLLRRVPGLRLDPARPSRITGLVFRKPRDLRVVWE
jgi:cytochrome P450